MTRWQCHALGGCFQLLRYLFARPFTVQSIKAAIYKNLLQEHVILSLLKKWQGKSPFLQHSALCHTTQSVIQVLNDENVEVMNWHSRSVLT